MSELTAEQRRVSERFPYGAKRRFLGREGFGPWQPITESDVDERGLVRLTRQWGRRYLSDLLADEAFCREYGSGEDE